MYFDGFVLHKFYWHNFYWHNFIGIGAHINFQLQ